MTPGLFGTVSPRRASGGGFPFQEAVMQSVRREAPVPKPEADISGGGYGGSADVAFDPWLSLSGPTVS